MGQAITQLRGEIRQLRAASQGSKQIPNLEQRLDQLAVLAAVQTGDVQIAGPATLPTTPSSPRPLRSAALGLFAGLLLGLLAILLAERLDQSVRDGDEASRLIGLPVIGTIPSARALSRNETSRTSGDGSLVGAAFGLLRTQLRYFNVDRKIGSVAVTSGGTGDGKTTVAWNLARAAAALSPESSVLVVDCDLRRSNIAGLAGCSAVPGLTELLTDSSGFDDAIRAIDVAWPPGGGPRATRLNVLCAGSQAPNPSELIESQKFRALIEELKDAYDFIVLDAPPPTLVPDAIPVMTAADGVVVVVRIRVTRRPSAKRLREQLSRLGVAAMGLVLNDIPSSASGYDSYYGGNHKRTSRHSERKTAEPVAGRPADVTSGP